MGWDDVCVRAETGNDNVEQERKGKKDEPVVKFPSVYHRYMYVLLQRDDRIGWDGRDVKGRGR